MGLLSLLRAGAFSGSSRGPRGPSLSRTDSMCDVHTGYGSTGGGRKSQTSTTWLVRCWQGRVQIPVPWGNLSGAQCTPGLAP